MKNPVGKTVITEVNTSYKGDEIEFFVVLQQKPERFRTNSEGETRGESGWKPQGHREVTVYNKSQMWQVKKIIQSPTTPWVVACDNLKKNSNHTVGGRLRQFKKKSNHTVGGRLRQF